MLGGSSIRQKSMFGLLLAVLIIGAAFILKDYFYGAGEIQYYVSPLGNDNNSGTLEAPFKTITKAQSVLKGLHPSGGATVFLRGGRYNLLQTVSFDQNDSGANGYPIVYQAYQNEVPVIDGTVQLPKPALESGNVYMVNMANVSGVDFRSTGITNVLINGKVKTLARYPNYQVPNFSQSDPWQGQYLYAASDTPLSQSKIKYASVSSDPSTWAGVNSGLKAVVFSGPNYWDSRVDVTSVDSVNRLINFGTNTSYQITPHNRFYLENSKSFLDQNGEWYYDKLSNKLFFYLSTPPSENDIFSAVANADIFNLSNANNLTFKGLTVRGSAGVAFNVRSSSATGSKNVSIIDNDISVTEKEAVRAGTFVTNLTVDGNNIHDIGLDGINISQDSSYFKNLTATNNSITNNVITDVGQKWRAKSGIDIYSVGTRVANNEVHDLPRMAILFRGNDNVIEYNRVYNLNQQTQDSGAIYMFGRSWLTRGNAVKNNYVYNTGGYGYSAGSWVYPYYTFGLYFDDFSSGSTVSNNVVVNTGQSGLIFHGGRDNVAQNNFLINSATQDSLGMIGINNQSSHLATMWTELNSMEQNGYDKTKYFARYPELSAIKQTMTNEELYANNKVMKNIFYSVGQTAHSSINSRQFLQGLGNQSDKNIFWSDKTFNIIDSYKSLVYSFTQWQGLGKDVNSLFTDPKFNSVANRNFGFQTGSSALILGISPINISETGPRSVVISSPIVSIIEPQNNDSLSGSALFSANVTDTEKVVSVEFRIDGTKVASFSTGQIAYSKTINTTAFTDGLHRFSVIAINSMGGVGSSSIDIAIGNAVDTDKPTISITSPSNNATLKRSTKITVNANDNKSVVKVEYYLDGQLFATSTTAPFSYTWNTKNVVAGVHKLVAKAYDAAGNIGVSSTVEITSASSGKGIFGR